MRTYTDAVKEMATTNTINISTLPEEVVSEIMENLEQFMDEVDVFKTSQDNETSMDYMIEATSGVSA